MTKNILILILLIAAVGAISAAIAAVRAGTLTAPADLAAKGLAASRKSAAVFFGLFVPVVTGVIAFFVLRFLSARSPATYETSFLWLAIGVAVVFTGLAAVVFKMRGFVEFTAMHVLYVAAFGWLMPRLLVF
jgi:hypothetical protein